jgi:hypothetical protein
LTNVYPNNKTNKNKKKKNNNNKVKSKPLELRSRVKIICLEDEETSWPVIAECSALQQQKRWEIFSTNHLFLILQTGQ